jgi:SNF2 family DNA or RNA helicase
MYVYIYIHTLTHMHRWMVEQHRLGIGGILGDEMGLGKTLQVISFISHLYETGEAGPYLIVCPLTVLPTWANEFSRCVHTYSYTFAWVFQPVKLVTALVRTFIFVLHSQISQVHTHDS